MRNMWLESGSPLAEQPQPGQKVLPPGAG